MADPLPTLTKDEGAGRTKHFFILDLEGEGYKFSVYVSKIDLRTANSTNL